MNNIDNCYIKYHSSGGIYYKKLIINAVVLSLKKFNLNYWYGSFAISHSIVSHFEVSINFFASDEYSEGII